MKLLKNVLFLSLLLILPVSIIPVHASIEDDAVDQVKSGIESVFGSLTKDINVNNDNFLNTTDDETEHLQNSGKNLFFSIIDMFKKTKDFAKDGVLFLSPYPVNAFLLTVIAIGFSVLFALSILKKIGKHLLILALVGLGIIMLFVLLGWNH